MSLISTSNIVRFYFYRKYLYYDFYQIYPIRILSNNTADPTRI
jgi:hypothetical protein